MPVWREDPAAGTSARNISEKGCKVYRKWLKTILYELLIFFVRIVNPRSSSDFKDKELVPNLPESLKAVLLSGMACPVPGAPQASAAIGIHHVSRNMLHSRIGSYLSISSLFNF